MRKLLKATLKIAGLLTLGGAVVGYKDHLDNKRDGRKPRTIYEDGIKRGLDWMCGMAAIIVFWPLYLIVAILVKIKLGSPVIYKTTRAGRINPKTGEEELFGLTKFRSMTNDVDENGNLLPDVDRLTRFGRLLRSTSLDELPEAFNIIKGDMSVIGPRPLPPSYLPYYTKEEQHRHDVRPGLSGWAQVNGRNSVKWDEKFKLDLEYVDKISFVEDAKIVFMSVTKALKRDDIGQGEERPGNLYDIRGN